MFVHDHAPSVWTTIHVQRDGTLETVLMVETDLPLSPPSGSPAAQRLADLTEAVVEYMRTHDHIDRAQFLPLGH